MKGRVRSYGKKNGYGFIESDTNEIFFFHHSEWHLPIKPQEKLLVEFEPVCTEKGWQARNVQRARREL